jgi:hypothetical protein
MKHRLIIAAALACACAPAVEPRVPAVILPETGGASEEFPANLRDVPFTVLVFLSADCPCFRAHEPRLRALRVAYEPRGVRFLLVDSERDASVVKDARLANERRYSIPIIVDAKAVLAEALAAEYATYSVVLDSRGAVRYRGGIDSDRSHLRADASFYLRDVLDDLLSGRAPRRVEAEALGCILPTR